MGVDELIFRGGSEGYQTSAIDPGKSIVAGAVVPFHAFFSNYDGAVSWYVYSYDDEPAGHITPDGVYTAPLAGEALRVTLLARTDDKREVATVVTIEPR
ncbi:MULTISPECIES: hypothetical protein [unclassified Pseudomonas]|uniref:hypothetical protein n=1 Tax=unclassified Pseudomonas TaxID=196821 RepID=UPI001CBCA625|nr:MULTISPECIES: hypothetical protein [unclassified Pseudomonas]